MKSYQPEQNQISDAVNLLSGIWEKCIRTPNIEPYWYVTQCINAKNEVLSHFQPIFSKKNIRTISEDDFCFFTKPTGNHHWRMLYRHNGILTANMNLLRSGLYILVDEDKPIQERLDKLFSKSGKMIPHLGKALLTPILLVEYPDKYGVWNSISEKGLRKLKILPSLPRNASFADRYLAINDVLLLLVEKLKQNYGDEIDLWTLDTFWWLIPGFNN